jgi:hypothetical protein
MNSGEVAYIAYEKYFGRTGRDFHDPSTPESFRQGWQQSADAVEIPLLIDIQELRAKIAELEKNLVATRIATHLAANHHVISDLERRLRDEEAIDCQST